MIDFDFDDFDSQVNCEEYYSGPTDAELQEMMRDGDWESIPMHPYDDEGLDVAELTAIVKGLGFDIIDVETIFE